MNWLHGIVGTVSLVFYRVLADNLLASTKWNNGSESRRERCARHQCRNSTYTLLGFSECEHHLCEKASFVMFCPNCYLP